MSISHSGSFVAVAVARRPVGIDIEDAADVVLRAGDLSMLLSDP